MRSLLVRATLLDVLLTYNGDQDDEITREKQRKSLEKLKKQLTEAEQRLVQARGNNDKEAESTLVSELIDIEKDIEKHTKAKDNALVTTLTYPRSGSSSVATVRTFDIPAGNRRADLGADDDFFTRCLFKEVIQGEAMLQVRITDSDKANRFLAFLRKVFVGIWGGFTGGAIKSISNIVVSSTAGEAASLIGQTLGGAKGGTKSEVVAQSKAVRLTIADDGQLRVSGEANSYTYSDGELTLSLLAPSYLEIGKVEVRRDTTVPLYMLKGEPNGSIRMRLVTEALQ